MGINVYAMNEGRVRLHSW